MCIPLAHACLPFFPVAPHPDRLNLLRKSTCLKPINRFRKETTENLQPNYYLALLEEMTALLKVLAQEISGSYQTLTNIE